MAKDAHPGKKNNLNALCERYSVDNSKRTLHGALLDAEILAEVYLAMTRGQESLLIDLPEDHRPPLSRQQGNGDGNQQRPARIIKASAEEIDAHHAILAAIQEASKGKCLWLRQDE